MKEQEVAKDNNYIILVHENLTILYTNNLIVMKSEIINI